MLLDNISIAILDTIYHVDILFFPFIREDTVGLKQIDRSDFCSSDSERGSVVGIILESREPYILSKGDEFFLPSREEEHFCGRDIT